MSDSELNIASFERVSETVSFLKERLPVSLQNPRVAIVCGTGLGGLIHTIGDTPRAEYDYSSVPNFPRLTVAGHAGKLVFGLLNQKVPVVLMLGRAHYYEGHSINQVTFPVRVLKLLGIDNIILTNAAGALNPEYAVGDIMLLNDVCFTPQNTLTGAKKIPTQHIFLAGLAGIHPLRGPNAEEFGPRFPPLSDAYDLELRRNVHKAWKTVIPSQSKRRLREGVYVFAGGPRCVIVFHRQLKSFAATDQLSSYETRAECRMLRQLGADVVGMSTVPEVVAARHCGIRAIALSLVTNNAVLTPIPRGDDHLLEGKDAKDLDALQQEGKANHEEVLEAACLAALDMQEKRALFTKSLTISSRQISK